jgi:hypothetical protein
MRRREAEVAVAELRDFVAARQRVREPEPEPAERGPEPGVFPQPVPAEPGERRVPVPAAPAGQWKLVPVAGAFPPRMRRVWVPDPGESA